MNTATKLTKRELELLDLVYNEFSNPEIADKLCISLKTVDTHKRNILQKTNSKSSIGLVKFGIKNGLFVLS